MCVYECVYTNGKEKKKKEMGRKIKMEKQKYLKKSEIVAVLIHRLGFCRAHLVSGREAFLPVSDNVKYKAKQRVFNKAIDVSHCVKGSIQLHNQVFFFF